jgi:bifunctional NMN adenylyltransferase/nudix hydrolase
LLALPGGFLAPDQTLEDSMIRELKEETQIKVPAQVLRGSIKNSHAFDYPERSQRGRTVTFTYFIELEPSLKDGLPRVKGGDDAAKAFWLPLSALGEKEDEFFEDHIHIIRYFLGL